MIPMYTKEDESKNYYVQNVRKSKKSLRARCV